MAAPPLAHDLLDRLWDVRSNKLTIRNAIAYPGTGTRYIGETGNQRLVTPDASGRHDHNWEWWKQTPPRWEQITEVD